MILIIGIILGLLTAIACHFVLKSPLKRRNPDLTVFLVVFLLGFLALAGIFFYAGYSNYQTDDMSGLAIWSGLGAIALAMATSSFLLLKWKKIGFWMMVASNIFAIVFSALYFSAALYPLFFFVAVVVGSLFALLQKKTDGVKCWDLLK